MIRAYAYIKPRDIQNVTVPDQTANEVVDDQVVDPEVVD